MPDDVAEDERRRRQPRDAAQRVEVRAEAEVAVAPLPARDPVARNRSHVHLEREQVVAALDAVLRNVLLQEELPVHALAHQASLHVGEGDDDGVDRALLDGASELLQGQHGE